MKLMHSVMGTEGKRPSASYEICLVPGRSFLFFISPTKSAEFLQAYLELARRGEMILSRKDARFS